MRHPGLRPASIRRTEGPMNRILRAMSAICCFAAIVMPAFVVAGEPVPDAKSLATAESLLEYCAKVDPAAADRYRREIATLVRGASENTLANVRKGDAYREARGRMTEFLAMVDEHNAKKVCARRPGQKPQ